MENSKNVPSRPSSPKTLDLFSFRPLNRPLRLDDVEGELTLMRDAMKSPLTVECVRRICEKSGTHLLKMVSPRADGENACLYFEDPASNRRPAILPSTNAPDIPFCKTIWRPLEIDGSQPMSVVDHVMNPTDISVTVLDAFQRVFGADVLDALRSTLLGGSRRVDSLAVGEFPIIFIPRPGGGDIQITPVSPAAAFMDMKRVTDPYFQKSVKGEPAPPRGRWHRQTVSSKMQNISGAISGSRVRFLATMPPGLDRADADLFKYVHNGAFPIWRDPDVATWVLRYAKMLKSDVTFNNRDTRTALNTVAERLIAEAETFIEEALCEARALALRLGMSQNLAAPPSIASVLLRRQWKSDVDRGAARNALTSPHFEHRLHLRADREK